MEGVEGKPYKFRAQREAEPCIRLQLVNTVFALKLQTECRKERSKATLTPLLTSPVPATDISNTALLYLLKQLFSQYPCL